MAAAAVVDGASAPALQVLVTVLVVELLQVLLRRFAVARAATPPPRIAELRSEIPKLRRTVQTISPQVGRRAAVLRPAHRVLASLTWRMWPPWALAPCPGRVHPLGSHAARAGPQDARAGEAWYGVAAHGAARHAIG